MKPRPTKPLNYFFSCFLVSEKNVLPMLPSEKLKLDRSALVPLPDVHGDVTAKNLDEPAAVLRLAKKLAELDALHVNKDAYHVKYNASILYYTEYRDRRPWLEGCEAETSDIEHNLYVDIARKMLKQLDRTKDVVIHLHLTPHNERFGIHAATEEELKEEAEKEAEAKRQELEARYRRFENNDWI